ncbi:hypothetical protein HDV01_001864 [Terramyces sp. JEL0728]|nr:hypothetical protein HDV01_001864 [Terramyces sp. JEL0728]
MLVFIFLVELISAATYCPIENQFCITAVPSNTTGQSCFTIHSAESGWAAMGVGSSMMAGADIYLGWKNQGTLRIGNLKGTGHVQPSVNSVQNAHIATLVDSSPSWSQLSFSFCRPTTLSANGNSIAPTQNYIFASCPDQASGTNASNLNFNQHVSNYGSFSFDFTTSTNTTTTGNTQPFLTPSGGYTYQQVVGIHGVFMFIAWAVSPFFGIFCARYLKNALGQNWYRLHVLFMGVTCGIATIVSFILIVLFIQPPHFDEKHKVIGLVIVIVLIGQVILGYVSNAKWDENRKDIPWWDKLHWWVGRAVFLLAVVNVYLGIDLYEDNFGDAPAFTAFFWICIILGAILMLYGQWKYGQVHHGYKNV